MIGVFLDKHLLMSYNAILMRGRAVVARRAHNPEVLGSNPSPATKIKPESLWLWFFLGSNPREAHLPGCQRGRCPRPTIKGVLALVFRSPDDDRIGGVYPSRAFWQPSAINRSSKAAFCSAVALGTSRSRFSRP